MANTYFSGRLKGSVRKVASKTAAYTADTDDEVILVSTAANADVTVTLPAAASSTNKMLTIVKTNAPTAAVLGTTAIGDNYNVIIDGNASETIGGLTTYVLCGQYEFVSIISDGSNWHVIAPVGQYQPRLLYRGVVDPIIDATVAMCTVPTGRTLKVTDIILEGLAAQSGGTSTTLKVGDTSAYSLLNGSSGHAFVAGTATTLLTAGKRVRPMDVYPIADTDTTTGTGMSGGYVASFAAAKVVGYNTSGTNLTAGSFIIEMYGYFI